MKKATFEEARKEVENSKPLKKSSVKYQEQEEQGENVKVGDARLRKKPLSPTSDPTTDYRFRLVLENTVTYIRLLLYSFHSILVQHRKL